MIVSLNALRNTRLFTSIHKDIKNVNALKWLNTINNTNWWSKQLENDNIMKKFIIETYEYQKYSNLL